MPEIRSAAGVRRIAEGTSSTGRASVSKTEGWGFKSLVPCIRKVVWPTRKQLSTYFVVVLTFVVFVIAIVSVLDLAFGWAMFKIFG
jgi:preprotein translocase SecE subunit